MQPFFPPNELPTTAEVLEMARTAHKLAVRYRNNPNPNDTRFIVQQLHDALYAAMHKLAALHLMLGANSAPPVED